MNDTSNPLTPKDNHPVDPFVVAAIRAMHRASEDLGLSMFVVGARARDLLLQHVYGLGIGRATTDIDFAFAVEGWEQFNAIKARLLTMPGFVDAKNQVQRLYFHGPDEPHPLPIDLIPFGEIENEESEIAWPPDMRIIMNVAGYDDALSSAVQVRLAPDVTVKVASLPGMAILKLFAWQDRGRENRKDAADLALLLQSYHQAGNQDRIYEEASDILEAVEYDTEIAGAWLLGCDMAATASPVNREKLRVLLSDQNLRARLTLDMARLLSGKEDAENYADALLTQFERNLTG